MAREVSQEYDCPHSMDFDLEGERLVYKGQRFRCSGCGGQHTAGVDVQVGTMVEDGDERAWPDLPESAEALRALVELPQPGPALAAEQVIIKLLRQLRTKAPHYREDVEALEAGRAWLAGRDRS